MTLHFVSSAEMIELMEGHPPPPASAGVEQRDGYFSIFTQRVEARYGFEYMVNFHLLAGFAPPEWDEHQQELHERAARAAHQAERGQRGARP
jgi:hypothetical protein